MIFSAKMRGRKVLSFKVCDDANMTFKESEHPRDKTGKFTSAAGSISNGIVKPKSNTAHGKTWNLINEFIDKNGKYPGKADLDKMSAEHGLKVGQTPKYAKWHYKFHGGELPAKKTDSKIDEPAAPEAISEPKIDNTVSNFKEKAKELNFKYEGKYNGIEYFINGNKKISYKEDTGTWAYKVNGSTVNAGSDLNSMMKEVPANETNASNEFGVQPENPSEHLTHTAPNYATKLPSANFKFSSKGIADESGFTESVRKSIERYKGSHYTKINKAMRYNTDFANVDQQTMIDILNIQRAFQQVPVTTHDCVVGRKFGLDAFKAMAKDAGIDNLMDIQAGMVLQEQAVCSTSHNTGVFSGEVNMRIKIPKGSKAIDLSETINKFEAETILPPGTNFKINSIKQNHQDFKFHIECEVVN